MFVRLIAKRESSDSDDDARRGYEWTYRFYFVLANRRYKMPNRTSHCVTDNDDRKRGILQLLAPMYRLSESRCVYLSSCRSLERCDINCSYSKERPNNL